ncbi:MAG TPA: filamentous hemagglutinin N-terminal domain-containing protein [Verrucomicrobiae bacterium]|nr:filamentous hemagglutinin N-terminal domain-containing protein [Verrucomicrobiae bacterium]
MKFHLKIFSFTVALLFIAKNFSLANPTGMSVASGSATARQNGSQLNITTSQSAFLNWSSFNIQAGETTTFIQPSANSVVVNAIGGASPSQIFGNLNANGTVILANANGFYFGPNSLVKVGGSFIATTAPLTPDFGAGSAWQFTGMPPLASIVNYGQIEVGNGKSLFLIAEQIDNEGKLSASGGSVGLYAGKNVLVSDRPDGRGLSATVQLPSGSVNNSGQITADAGTIALNAQVVNQNGIIQADSIQNQNGEIELIASDQLNLGANSKISANGDDSIGGSSGGNVVLKSQNNFSDNDGSQISVTGGSQGGNGGNLEISAPNILSLNSQLDARAQNGWSGGTFFLDPVNIILGTSTANGAINVNSAFTGFSQIDLQASGNITLNASVTWDLSSSTGNGSGQLTLQAGGDILFQNNAKIVDENNWSVTLEAGYNFVNNVVQSGVGNIYLNNNSGGVTGGGWIQTTAGNVNLIAGQNILVGSGSVSTIGGGSIFADALAGNINAGSFNGGTSFTSASSDYSFSDSGATPNPVLGGISTGAGGDVTLLAGNNITSTPTVPARQAPGASGAYGSGDVTVIAGNQITGNFNLANGTGTMLAGVTISSAQVNILQNPTANPSATSATLNDLKIAVTQSQNANGNVGAAPVAGNPSTAPVTLSLISGAWNVWAANDISIKEVNNPNGAFNVADSFQYNYAPDAAANFWAGNAIEFIGANLGRLTSQNRTPIYAPVLSLDAGAGGIKFDTSIILAPSSEGELSVVTREGGNLTAAPISGSTALNGITMSDSSSSDYKTFTSEHDDIHLNDPNPQPVYLDISGSIGNFNLIVPTFADITVEGAKPFVTPDGSDVCGTYNFGFQGRNLSASQTTSINVLGALTYRGDLTTIDLTAAQLADLLPTILFSDSADVAVTSKLHYDPTTGELSYVGVMSASDLAFLLNPSVLVLDKNGRPEIQLLRDANGHPILDANGNYETVPVTKPLVLDSTQKAMINQLAIASQSASLGDQGLTLTGPGNFNVSANSIDLGVSGGIRVLAPDSALATISPDGANLSVTTIGDLSMTATKISNESFLGNVNVNVGGTLDVGGQFTTLGDASSPKGIFSTSGGNVSVIANGDVDVDGSRIAAYNGGNVTVESQNGDVNAGIGSEGYVTLNALEINPVTGQLIVIPAIAAGSGILATTVHGSHALLGNITINAPNGDINASLGGITQISFNGADTKNNFIELNAGNDINAEGSGIIGSNIRLQAGGNINGLVIGSQSVNINSAQNVDVVAVSGGDVNINASGDIAGTVVGGGSVNVSGDSITASLVSGSISASGDVSGASVGVPQSTASKNNAETADDASTIAAKTDDNDDELKKKKKGIALAQKISRVTVLLPQKNRND